MSIRNFGPQSLKELRDHLSAHGYHYGAPADSAGSEESGQEAAEASGTSGDTNHVAVAQLEETE
ncbi:hypothetical protein NITHO_3740005 [Nitrolancea hollandica Lb]|uniref:RNA polymerase alpha subunit C-terminal domain-containing protein n=1 Tax=Nitrolancea hollandica Lb TaxID=1129897 RepID=I4EJ09_9BACT|nr:hypothetical protein NITHO_3740005 [Nitrolancea hollandica Lb]